MSAPDVRQSPRERITELIVMAETAEPDAAAYYRERAHEIEDALFDGNDELAAALTADDHERVEQLRTAGGAR